MVLILFWLKQNTLLWCFQITALLNIWVGKKNPEDFSDAFLWLGHQSDKHFTQNFNHLW